MKQRYIPQNATEIKKEGVPAVVYTFESQGTPYAIGYSGKAARPNFYYRFGNEEKRQEYIQKFLESVERSQNYRAELKLNKKSETQKFLESLNPGVILSCSWGYEQTNVDFYKVLERNGSKVTLVKIAPQSLRETGWASDVVVANPNQEIGAPFEKIVRSSWIRISDCQAITVWNGKELHRSWYA